MALIDRGQVMTDYLENLGRKDSYKAKYEALSKAVDEAPAIEAEPIKYGEFAILEEQFFPSITATIKRCKTCNVEFILLFREALEGYYCPRCGARKKEADNAQK